MKLDYSESEMAGPNLTPVIDIVFLLLIFFLVATRFEQEEKDIRVKVPVVAEARPRSMPPPVLTVNVLNDGTYTINGKTVSDDQLQAILKQHSNANPGTQKVLIRGHKTVNFQYPVRVGGYCEQANLKPSFGVMTTK